MSSEKPKPKSKRKQEEKCMHVRYLALFVFHTQEIIILIGGVAIAPPLNHVKLTKTPVM
jgi:hypothetical protein